MACILVLVWWQAWKSGDGNFAVKNGCFLIGAFSNAAFMVM